MIWPVALPDPVSHTATSDDSLFHRDDPASPDPAGDAGILPIVYDELRQIALRAMRGQSADHTLQPTALVHEAYLRMLGCDDARRADRDALCALAASAMRTVLVDHFRARTAQKRGGKRTKLALDEDLAAADEVDRVSLLALDEALARLRSFDTELAAIVDLRFFAGLSVDETARLIGVSQRTVKRGWRSARAWLLRQLAEDGDGEG